LARRSGASKEKRRQQPIKDTLGRHQLLLRKAGAERWEQHWRREREQKRDREQQGALKAGGVRHQLLGLALAVIDPEVGENRDD